MCDIHHVLGNDYDIQIFPEGGDCLQAWKKPKRWEKVCVREYLLLIAQL